MYKNVEYTKLCHITAMLNHLRVILNPRLARPCLRDDARHL